MASVSVSARQDREVRVGIVGPRELVERVMLSGLPALPGSAAHVPPADAELGLRRRLVMAPYLNEHEAPEKVARLGGTVSALLFASRIPLDYARRAGVLRCPATSIQLGGTSLYAALGRARRSGFDPAQASFDGLSRDELDAGLADLGLDGEGAHLRAETASAAASASFHERLWQLGQTTVAVTCMEPVADRLRAAGVPVISLRPTDESIRSSLQVATLLASHQVLSESQLAVAVVEVPALRISSRRPAPRHAREELQLTVHRFLVREAQRVHATVSQLGEHAFLVFATRGSLAAAGEPPFAAAAQEALGMTLEVGVGTGRTEHEAEAQARLWLSESPQATRRAVSSPRGRGAARGLAEASSGHGTGAASGRAGETSAGSSRAGETSAGSSRAGETSAGGAEPSGLADFAQRLQAGRAVRLPGDSLSRLRALETLSKLAQKLTTDSAPVVDAELTGRLLSVTPRTARRQLRALVEEGLALPLPPARQQHPGRPRLAYRLVVEKLERRAQ
jgi:hypothetical protein